MYREITEIDAVTARNVSSLFLHYAPSEVVSAEERICEELDYRFSGPTAHQFLQRFLTFTSPRRCTKKFAEYLLKCTLYVEELLEYRPSAVAATVVCLAIRNPESLENDPLEMQSAILAYSKFPLSYLVEIAQILEDNIKIPSKAQKEVL